MAQYERLYGGGDVLDVNNPKRFNFAANYMGHLDRATVDEQMMGLIRPDKSAPQKEFYGVYERPLHELASRYDVDPARFQDVAWAGSKYLKDGSQPAPMMQTVNELIERTSRVTGLDPDEVLRDSIIRSVRPGYAKGGRVDSELACNCRA